MRPISVVIITKNEAAIIGTTLAPLKALTDDLLVADNGSTDATVSIAQSVGARVINVPWQGYGPTKNAALSHAKYDWILALDADETPDEELLQSLQQCDLSHPNILYLLSYRNFIGTREIKYGEWKPPVKIRLFHRGFTQWKNEQIHEGLMRPEGFQEVVLNGRLLHTSMQNLHEYALKMVRYADLMAEKYAAENKKASGFKIYVYPIIAFFQAYILKLGFLDGSLGFMAARMSAFYAFYKYYRLSEINASKKQG